MKKTLRDNKRWFIGLGIGVLAAVIFPQVVRIRFVWNLLSLILVWAIVGMGWNVIGGYCGQVSNGHSLFYGIGAYTVGLAVSYFKISPWISIWIGVGISMLIAFSGKTSPEAEGTCICHIHHGSGGMYQNHIHQLEMVRGRHRSLYLFKRCE